MAQTTTAISSKNGKIEYCLNVDAGPAVWVDISGTANSVTSTGGNRKSGDGYTASGDTPLIVSGKRESLEVTVKVVYTEAAGTPNAFEDLHAVYVSGDGAAIRWTPTTGGAVYSTASTAGAAIECPITSFNYPALDFSSGDPIMIEFTVKCSAILTA